MDLEDFSFIDEGAITTAADGLTIEGQPATALQKAQAMKLYRKARAAAAEANVPLPGLPLVKPSAPSVAEPAPAGPLMLKQSQYMDQASEATFPLLSPDEIYKLRQVFLCLIPQVQQIHLYLQF